VWVLGARASMSLLLLLLGILLAGAGAAAIGFGIPINELPLGGTLIVAGTTGLVGGLLMLALSVAVAELTSISRNLKTRPVAHASRPAEPEVQAAPVRDPASAELKAEPPLPPEAPPAPAPESTVDVSASAIERLRSTIPRAERSVPVTEGVPLSPNGQQPYAEPQPRPVGAAAVEPPREPRLDFLFRSRQAGRPSPQPESFEALWPKRPGREPQVESTTEPGVETKGPPSAEQERSPPSPAADTVRVLPAAPVAAPTSPAEAPRPVAILKSGVVDGMAYTLYADGSIEAQLPQGTVRFGSIAELRTHIEKNSA
jgi:hypothetical protein